MSRLEEVTVTAFSKRTLTLRNGGEDQGGDREIVTGEEIIHQSTRTL